MSKDHDLSVSQAENEVENAAGQVIEVEGTDTQETDVEQIEVELSEVEQSEIEQPEVSIEELQKQLEQAKQQAEQNLDKAVRARAEMENLRKRTQKDLENAHKFALEKFAGELLTVIDSLELGIQASSDDNPEVAKLREGSELTLKQFASVFSKFNIEAIDPLGEPFNPEQHQAMSMQPSTEFAPNTVMNVFQKGYLLNGRLIRPAMVVVAKAAEQNAKDQLQA